MPKLNEVEPKTAFAARVGLTKGRISQLVRANINALIDQYGIDAFHAAQQGIIDYVERVVRGRLREIPDGQWYAKGYHDHDGNTDAIYPICCRITKTADQLTIDFTGTAPQAIGSINCARPAMEASVRTRHVTL